MILFMKSNKNYLNLINSKFNQITISMIKLLLFKVKYKNNPISYKIIKNLNLINISINIVYHYQYLGKNNQIYKINFLLFLM